MRDKVSCIVFAFFFRQKLLAALQYGAEIQRFNWV